MELFEHQNNHTKLSKPSNITKFLDLLFLISVLLLYSSMLPFIFNLMHFFSSNIGKNYMFLLCNGILVFIVKNSGLMCSSHHEINLIKNGESPQIQLETVPAEKQVHEIADKSLVMVEGALVTQDVASEELNEIAIVDEEDEEEIEMLNVDQLNKKCDDFIRRMKEEIKFEAQQLILIQH
ncbi:hypothetical protein P3X46_012056 [Hevea brasiliensis]|uniref:DUF4408 domain-containing protein n=1 Tax=Hevea brasiliensis TaxID=3981 RepID=A0ABQ9M915_HEVBR|nr:hypothetical protein P3X46_012056 [Hevea brasiliensis]